MTCPIADISMHAANADRCGVAVADDHGRSRTVRLRRYRTCLIRVFESEFDAAYVRVI